MDLGKVLLMTMYDKLLPSNTGLRIFKLKWRLIFSRWENQVSEPLSKLPKATLYIRDRVMITGQALISSLIFPFGLFEQLGKGEPCFQTRKACAYPLYWIHCPTWSPSQPTRPHLSAGPSTFPLLLPRIHILFDHSCFSGISCGLMQGHCYP